MKLLVLEVIATMLKRNIKHKPSMRTDPTKE